MVTRSIDPIDGTNNFVNGVPIFAWFADVECVPLQCWIWLPNRGCITAAGLVLIVIEIQLDNVANRPPPVDR